VLSSVPGTVAPLAIDEALGHVYQACDPPDACIEVIDAHTREPVARVPVEHSWRPVAIAVNPETHLVYAVSAVFDPDAVRGVVTVIDGRVAAPVATLAVGPGPQAVAVDPRTNRVYVTEETGVDGDAAVAVIDGATRRILTTVPIGPYARYFDNPHGLAVDPATHVVYASNPVQGVVYAIDGTTGAVLRSITIGDAPAALAVDPDSGAVVVTTARGIVVVAAR
jgi:DNA-binding beta-propeller fold protein YncE